VAKAYSLLPMKHYPEKPLTLSWSIPS